MNQSAPLPASGRVPGRARTIAFWVVVGVLLGAHLLLGMRTITALSLTFDETTHLAAGYIYLRTGNYRLNTLNQPPAAEMWAALPLLALKPEIPEGQPGLSDDVQTLEYSYCDRFIYRNNVDPDLLLNAGRMMILVLSLLLGLLLFVWSRALFGNGAALACLALWAFFPPFLAHGTLVTIDMALTLGFTATLYLAWRWWRAHLEQRPGWRETIAVGLSVGLVLAVKYSGVIVLPVLGFLFAAGLLTKGLRPRRAITQGLAAGFVALFALLVVYQFRPLTLWFWPGFRHVFEGTFGGRPTFFLGKHFAEGVPSYFPVMFLLKTPLPAILVFVLAAFRRRLWTRDLSLFILFPALLYFSVACLAKMNIGHRHILPVYPFLMIWASGLASLPLPSRRAVRQPVLVLVGLLSAWYAFGTLRAHPWHLSYFNELIGSQDRGYLYATDSSVDWGQGLRALSAYVRRERIDGIYLSYFGSADPAYYGIRYLPLVFVDGLTPEYFQEARHGDPTIATQSRIVLAVSATNLQGTYFTDQGFFAFLKPLTPDAVVADSILVYDLDRHPEQKRYFLQLLGAPGAN